MRLVCLILVLGAAGLPSGCGTFNNGVAMSYSQYQHAMSVATGDKDYKPKDYTYGGTKYDAEALHEALFKPGVSPLVRLSAPLWLIDMPFSAIGDALDLPKARAATEQEAKWSKEMKAKRTENPPAADPASGSTDRTASAGVI